MALEHDYIKFPELTKKQMAEFGFTSPHEQIESDFFATVVKVHDGDTITLRTDFRDFDFPLRFLGIDAPEMNAGGEVARDWLKDRILGAIVKILINIENKVDKYGRLLGEVIFRGINMGEAELRQGLALPFNRRGEGKIPPITKELDIRKWLG